MKVMLKSLFLNNLGERFAVYLLHSSLTKEELEDLKNYIEGQGHQLELVKIDDSYFAKAPVLLHYVSNGLWDMDQIIRHTVILHFCGKRKPWRKDYSGKFHSLYKHYEKSVLIG